MKPQYEPISALADHEAVRFVGTVGDVLSGVLRVYTAVIESFSSRDLRSASELRQTIMETASCDVRVARETVNVMSALQLVTPVPGVQVKDRRYAIADRGRAVLGVINIPGVTEGFAASSLILPLFEGHGDYLLQAMEAIANSHDWASALKAFIDNVRALPRAKLSEMPSHVSGVNWQVYRLAVKNRLDPASRSANGERPTEHLTIEALKRQQERRSREHLRAAGIVASKSGHSKSEPSGGSDPKTFEHHFVRCRKWLDELGLLTRTGEHVRLSTEGERMLAYFREKSVNSGPTRIAPSLSLLQDCFRLSEEEVAEHWGMVVTPEFWENAVYDYSGVGQYEPTDSECDRWFAEAFDRTRIPFVPEAGIQTLRTALFWAAIWENRALRPSQLDDLIDGVLERNRSRFGVGRNRQGRMAYVFRKT